MSKKFYVKKDALKCPIGIEVCPKTGCLYFNLAVGCNHYEIIKREGLRRKRERQRRMDEAAKLVRLSDGPVYGKSEG